MESRPPGRWPPTVDLHKGQQEQMRQRQPHRAEFAKAGQACIEDAPRDVQMSDGIAVVEQRAVRQLHKNAAMEAAAHEISTVSHSQREMGWTGLEFSVKVSQLAEEVETVVDLAP